MFLLSFLYVFGRRKVNIRVARREVLLKTFKFGSNFHNLFKGDGGGKALHGEALLRH